LASFANLVQDRFLELCETLKSEFSVKRNLLEKKHSLISEGVAVLCTEISQLWGKTRLSTLELPQLEGVLATDS